MAAISTLPGDVDAARVRRAHNLRRLFLILLAAFLIAGATNAFGVRTRTTIVRGGGYTLAVTYAQISRPGLATPWSIEVTRPGGFADVVVIATKASYFDGFDENGLDPDASSSVAEDEWLIWEFEAPDGETLVVSFDARIEPGVQLARLVGATRVLEDGAPVVEATYRTWVMP